VEQGRGDGGSGDVNNNVMNNYIWNKIRKITRGLEVTRLIVPFFFCETKEWGKKRSGKMKRSIHNNTNQEKKMMVTELSVGKHQHKGGGK